MRASHDGSVWTHGYGLRLSAGSAFGGSHVVRYDDGATTVSLSETKVMSAVHVSVSHFQSWLNANGLSSTMHLAECLSVEVDAQRDRIAF